MSSLSRPTLVNKDAAAKGNAGAVENRNIIAKRLTPQQLAEAQKLARECQARDFKGC